MTQQIGIEHTPTKENLDRLGIHGWPIWEKEVSEFPWHYDETETCYLLEGDVTVTTEGGQPVRFGKGDLVTFPAGMSCTWTVHKPVRKHYKFG
jgi:uncharacterized cupin superfamily protein